MKYLILMTLALTVTSNSALANEPQDSCAKNVADVVASQAKLDFPGLDIVVPRPDLGRWDGGEVVSLEVPVFQAQNLARQLGVYDLMIDEVCDPTHPPILEH